MFVPLSHLYQWYGVTSYNTPSFWTTVHNAHLGQRNVLALVKSGKRPLAINLDCTHTSLQALRSLCYEISASIYLECIRVSLRKW